MTQQCAECDCKNPPDGCNWIKPAGDNTWAKGYAAAKEAARGELEWLRAEIERLQTALDRYGLHTWDCDWNDSQGAKPCNCGWDSVQQGAADK